MAVNNFERLTAQDLQFLVMESPTMPMDMVSTQIYARGPLMQADGGVDIDSYRENIESILHRVPRARQKLKWIPYADIPVWVDDPNFNIEYHIRHTALPSPGSREQLKNLTARIIERPLDRERPLWELWLVEGLENQRYAIISKIHHCMLDALGGISLSPVFLSPSAEQVLPEAPPFMPGKAPSEVSLLWDEWNRRYAQPIDALRNAGELLRRPMSGIGELEKRFGAVRSSLTSMIRRPPDTPINGDLCSHRRVEWLELPLHPFKDAHQLLVCSFNDVVLGLLAGGIRKLFSERGFDLKRGDFKLAMPVHSGRDDSTAGDNSISTWLLTLPIDEADPLDRIETIACKTAKLKGEEQGSITSLKEDLAAWIPRGLLSLFTAAKGSSINTLFTAIAGSPQPLYSMGAEMEAMYTHVPLSQGIGLATTLMSYDGKLYWGFNGDYDLLPDIELVAQGVSESFYTLMEALDISVDGGGESKKTGRTARPKAALGNTKTKAKSGSKQASSKAKKFGKHKSRGGGRAG
jgi:diacylglycerol O-acyltransferase